MADNNVTRTGDSADREQRLEAVIAEFLRACDAGTAPDRRVILEQHPELADDLRDFFSNHDRMDQFARPLVAAVPAYERSTLVRPEAEQVGLCIGPYTLVQKLGEGSMGEVWVAKQSEPVKRKVALKLIKRGMNSKDVLTRFEQERQALAMMDHPNIAKVFDGGVVGQAFQPDSATPSQAGKPDVHAGQPYFVMELVNGLPLTKFCDEAKLTPRERMELFVPICQAVQHAHQKGIVHRDLKPSNILVTLYDGKPVPKVIDFGVAKATGGKLTDDSMSTQFGAVVGTLEYMSPEQAGFSGQDIDTRADIYSLGVILYELLTGLRPIDAQRLRQAAFTEMIRIIQEEEPSKPSTRLSSNASLPSLAALRQTDPKRLTALLRGELDWVVMKCLEKSRDRRYETVNGLARDIQRYLADEPVEARPPSASYRFSKFLRRHKGPVIAASLVMLALIGGIIGTSWGLVREANQRKIAETNEGKANAAADQERIAKEKEQIAKENAVAIAIDERKQRDRADENAKLARRHLYLADMRLIQHAVDAGRLGAVPNLLNRHIPHPKEEDLRGFEWFYWHRVCHLDLYTLKPHMGQNWNAAFKPDGSLIASSHSGGTVKLWDAGIGQQTATLKAGSGRIVHSRFSPDCARVAALLSDNTVKLWDAVTGQPTVTLKGNKDQFAMIWFSPNGTQIATSSSNGSVRLWDTTTGQEVVALKGPTDQYPRVWFGPNGAQIATAGRDSTVRLWNTATGTETTMLKGQARMVLSVAFSSDGTRLVTATTDKAMKLWDTATGREIVTLNGHANPVNKVVFNRNDSMIASASADKTVKLWDGASYKFIATLAGHTGSVFDIAFNTDGTHLVSASEDQSVKLWDAVSGQEIATLRGHTARVNSVSFSPEGTRIVSVGSDDMVRLWDAATDRTHKTLKGNTGAVDGVAFSPDGTRVAAACRHQKVTLWDLDTGNVTATLKGHADWVRSVTFSPNGTQIASVDDRENVKVWDAATGQETRTLTGGCVAFSSDGALIATANSGATVKVWDSVTGLEKNMIPKAHSAKVTSITFSSDRKWIITASKDSTLKILNAATGREIRTLRGHTDEVSCVAFSPVGARIASGSRDGTVRLWDAVTGQATETLKGHTDKVYCVAFSPDGKRIASASNDQTMKLWDVVTGQETLTLKDTDSVRSVAFSPDGTWIATAGNWANPGGWVKLWNAPQTEIR